SYLIGNGSDCDLRLDDPFLSAHHARIRLRESGAGYEIEDLGSKNGVFVNGLRVERAFLPKHGNLRLGRSHISWQDKEASSPSMLN
ncbi:Fis family transcriptional regulator, partial [Pseudomonas sp. FW305-20]|uniref:FHA domain-containing protein n=1 Tax=Pseudomonas sp. FW305-20 TaxID=2070560 RepID=UPI000CB8C1C3